MTIQHRGGDAWRVSVYIGTEGGAKKYYRETIHGKNTFETLIPACQELLGGYARVKWCHQW